MGQKVHPFGMRLGIIFQSNSRWFPQNGSFSEILFEDINIRKYIRNSISKNAYISNIIIERTNQNIKITIKTAKPGIVIGKKGEDIDKLRLDISKKYKSNVTIGIEEIKKPELDAFLVATNVATQLENRVLFRRVMKRSINSTMRNGAKGVKISVAGRLGGSEIARIEWNREGRVPLHTFRADIDYGVAEAKTTYGIIGVKVWIFKGEILGGKHYQSK